MNRWRVIVLATVLVAGVIIVASEIMTDSPTSWYPWKAPMVFRRAAHPRNFVSPENRDLLQSVGAQLASLVSHFLVGVLVLLAAPRRLARLSKALAAEGRALLRYLAIGLLLAVTTAAVGVLSMLSVQTFPLPFILAVIFFLAALSGVVALAYQLGRELLSRADWTGETPLPALALGTLIVFATTRIPIVGWAALALVWLTGAGVAIATRFGGGEPWSLRPLVEDE